MHFDAFRITFSPHPELISEPKGEDDTWSYLVDQHNDGDSIVAYVTDPTGVNTKLFETCPITCDDRENETEDERTARWEQEHRACLNAYHDALRACFEHAMNTFDHEHQLVP